MFIIFNNYNVVIINKKNSLIMSLFFFGFTKNSIKEQLQMLNAKKQI